jgi:hypothetical protein
LREENKMNTVQKAKITTNFITPKVGPVRLGGFNVVLESGETFRCATRREARELIAQCGFVEVSDFDPPDAPKRYFTDEGDIDWEFIGSASVGLRRDLSISEQEIRQAHYLSGRLGVLRWLVRHGEIAPDDVQIDETAQAAAQQFSAYLADRHRKHSLWARSRKTTSY